MKDGGSDNYFELILGCWGFLCYFWWAIWGSVFLSGVFVAKACVAQNQANNEKQLKYQEESCHDYGRGTWRSIQLESSMVSGEGLNDPLRWFS